MESCACLGIAFVVFDAASEARVPGEGSFHNPTSWKQGKAALGLGWYDDCERDTVFGYRIGGAAFAGTPQHRAADPWASTATARPPLRYRAAR